MTVRELREVDRADNAEVLAYHKAKVKSNSEERSCSPSSPSTATR